LEAVWHFTGRFTPKGNIGKYPNQAIEAWVEWDGEPGSMIAALVGAGWLDCDSDERLLVHDWSQHADKATKQALSRAQQTFCVPSVCTPCADSELCTHTETESGTAFGLPVPVPVPVPVPEPVQKPSRGKHEAKEPDERHQQFKIAIGDYWAAKNPGIEMPWDGSEGKALGMLLSASPHLDLKAFVGLLRSRFKSEVNHSDRPSKWMRSASSYASGPLDRFGKPINPNGGSGNGKGNNSPTKQRVDGNRRAVAEAAIKLGWISPDSFDGRLGEAVSESGHGGCDAGVHDGLRPVGPEILAPEGTAGGSRFTD
jgi:hypothetical protein